jgi:hypothetical protein
MALPLLTYGIDKLYLFPVYGTREQYQLATGQEAPPFDPAKPPKFWFDAKAASSGKRNVVYDSVLALDAFGRPMLDAAGQVMLEPMVLTAQQASAVNIPYMKTANEEGSGQIPVPVPLRDPEPDEELYIDRAQNVSIRNKKLWAENSDKGVFSPQDRELLRAIARKLGVPVAD